MVTKFLRSSDGQRLVETLLEGLPAEDAQKALWVLRLVESLERVPTNYLKKLTGTEDIWEIRIQGT